jgi:hypothetical protein
MMNEREELQLLVAMIVNDHVVRNEREREERPYRTIEQIYAKCVPIRGTLVDIIA